MNAFTLAANFSIVYLINYRDGAGMITPIGPRTPAVNISLGNLPKVDRAGQVLAW